jgi:hypothetical protein
MNSVWTRIFSRLYTMAEEFAVENPMRADPREDLLRGRVGEVRETDRHLQTEFIRKLMASITLISASVPCGLAYGSVPACVGLAGMSLTGAVLILATMVCVLRDANANRTLLERLEAELSIVQRMARENPGAQARIVPVGTGDNTIFAFYLNGRPIVATAVEGHGGDPTFVPPPGYSTGLPKGGTRRKRRVNRRSRYRQVS